MEGKVHMNSNSLPVAQTLTYLKLTGIRRALLLNFNKKTLRDGIKRVSL